jgi:hypothetical protein
MITRVVWSRLSPRIGRSLALSLPWSHSTRLLAYRSVFWNAAGRSPSTATRKRRRSIGDDLDDLDGLAVRADRGGEEPTRGPEIALGRDAHVDDLPELVDRPSGRALSRTATEL